MDTLKTIQEIERILFLQSLPDVISKLTYIQQLKRTWQLVKTTYADNDLSLEKAARVSGVNKNHLNMLFRQAIGLTFHQFLVRYRTLSAIAMMKTQDYSILQIALENGFGSLTTFERNFRNLVGSTPKEFRANQLPRINMDVRSQDQDF